MGEVIAGKFRELSADRITMTVREVAGDTVHAAEQIIQPVPQVGTVHNRLAFALRAFAADIEARGRLGA